MRPYFWLWFLCAASTVSTSRQWPTISRDAGEVDAQERESASLRTLSAQTLLSGVTDALEDDAMRIPFDDPLPPPPIARQASSNSSSSSSSPDLTTSWTPPLSTRGRYVVDANGQRFRLVAGNWHGASGTYLGRGDINDPSTHHAGEQAFQTPLCLDRVPIDDIVQSFLDLNINTIRLPFSNEMLHSIDVPPSTALRANPQLMGMTPLQIFDACIEALTRRGLAVILNNHTVKSLWCCGVDVNSRWNGAQSDEQWQNDWVFLMRRYANNPRVVGAELYNEVRRDYLADPTWGSGSSTTDWWGASQTAASRILREANANALIVVEGINFVGIPTKYTQHYRPELQPVAQVSHALPVLDKLVYSAHFYAYTGANATGGDVDLGTDDPLYRDLTPSVLDSMMRMLAFYVSNDTQRHYTTPVWISEFGSAGRTDYLNKDRWWWSNFTDLMVKYDAEFAVWPLLGWQQDGHGDGWAMHMFDTSAQRLSILDPGDWRLSDFSKLVNDTTAFSGAVARPASTFVQLYTQQGSVQQSNRLQHDDSHLSQPGKTRASCPDGLRLHGLSRHDSPAGLCTDATFGRDLWNASNGAAYTVITTEVPAARAPVDWASGLTKFQCADDAHVIGYSFNDGGAMQSIVCGQTSAAGTAAAAATASPGLRTIFFGTASNVANDRGQWYAADATAATCADDEVLIGVGFTTHNDVGRPQAIHCRNFHGTNAVVGVMGIKSAGARGIDASKQTVVRAVLAAGIVAAALFVPPT